MIDWNSIGTVDDLLKYETDLFDEAPDVTEFQRNWVNPNLAPEEKEDAEYWSQFKRGIWLLMSPPGSGKNMLADMIAYKFKRYYGLTSVLDHRPRRLFGAYVPFSTHMLADQMERMTEVSTGVVKLPLLPKKKPKNEDEEMALVAIEAQREKIKQLLDNGFKPYVTSDGKWISSRGEVFLRNAVIVLDEFDTKFMYRRDTDTKPLKREILKLFSYWRHLNCIIIGLGTEFAQVDPGCFPKVTMKVITRVLDEKDLLFGIIMKPMRYVKEGNVLIQASKPIKFFLDGEKPREMLGGLAWKDLYNTDQATEIHVPPSLRREQ